MPAMRPPQRPSKRALILAAAAVVVLALAFVVGPRLARQAHHGIKNDRVQDYDTLITEHAEATDLPRDLVRAVVLAESGGHAAARSNKDAVGLMQITPITLKEVRRHHPDLPRGDLTDPAFNLRVGTAYLAYLLDRFDGDQTLTLAAYHMGPTAVRRLQRAHPDLSPDALIDAHAGPQTRAYVKKVAQTVAQP